MQNERYFRGVRTMRSPDMRFSLDITFQYDRALLPDTDHLYLLSARTKPTVMRPPHSRYVPSS
jgi:hypothetical protein